MLTKRLLKPMAACFLAAAIFTLSCKKDTNEAPVVTFESPTNNQEFHVDDTVTILVNASDPDGYISKIVFYVNDAEIFVENKYPYTYDWVVSSEYTPGEFTIKAIAEDLELESKTEQVKIIILQDKPASNFTVDADDALPGKEINFTDQSKYRPTSWLWDFGDGQSSTEQNPAHTYSIAGKYTVKLTATNQFGGNTITKNEYVNVMTPVLEDIDGYQYDLVQIGRQVWMAGNLKTTHYADGTAIPNGAGLVLQNTNSTPAYYFEYNDNGSYTVNYGRLYNKAAMLRGYTTAESENDTIQGVCPDGWHVPTTAEWDILINYLGGKDIAGSKLKATGTDYWFAPNTGATNESGFNARGAGYRSYSNKYENLKKATVFGSATRNNTISVNNDKTEAAQTSVYNSNGFSVRCIKD